MVTEYRSDIDGLRAIAVLAVVFYHLFPEWVSGGYVGVDVFFVISGFLITGIIYKSLQQGRFTFKDFYARRIRRIFPALVLVLGFCLWYGWYSLLPEEYVSLNRLIAASGAFIANFVLWEKTVEHGGYFNTAAELKPLLHLWSLSIEEQFYLIWPPLCLWLYKSKSSLLKVALGIAAVSLGLNLFMIEKYPAATFYLPHTRFWELMLGGVLAVVTLPDLKKWREPASVLGLLLLLFGIFSFTSADPFPGWRALLPTVGTFLLIAAGPQAWVNRRLLSLKTLVFVGLISYPLYLWHWPLFSFSRIENIEPLTLGYRFGLLIASLVLAWGTYQFIEKPIRHAKNPWRAYVTAGALAGLAAICIAAKIFMKIDLPTRLMNANAKATVSSLSLGEGLDVDNTCFLNPEEQKLTSDCHSDKREKPVNVVYGDSRANAIFSGLYHSSLPGERWSVLARRGCAPLSGFKRDKATAESDAQECDKLNSVALQVLEQNKHIKVVLIAMAARVIDETLEMAEKDNGAAFYNALIETIRRLEASGKKIFWLEDNPYMVDPQYCLKKILNQKNHSQESCGISAARHEEQYKNYYAFMLKLKNKFPNVTFFDPTNLLCQDGFCPMLKDGKFLYSDKDHYSDFGSTQIATNIIQTLSELKKN